MIRTQERSQVFFSILNPTEPLFLPYRLNLPKTMIYGASRSFVGWSTSLDNDVELINDT